MAGGSYLEEPRASPRHRLGVYGYRATMVAVITLALVAVGQAAFSSTPTRVAADMPLPISVAPAPPTTAPPATVAQPPPPEPAPAPTPAPVDIPGDSYATEPIVQIGSIEIPKIGVSEPAFQGVTLRNIDLGPSHWPGTALPGQRGNTVFAGHRVTHSRPFRDIDQLVAGDQVIFTVNGVRSVYRMTGNMVVDPSDTWIAQQTSAATGTLYACHPPGSAGERFVVRLELDQPAV